MTRQKTNMHNAREIHSKTKSRIPRVLCIVGPTSSGKTALGIQLAKKYHGEIINADARQVYQEFSIGTGKPAGGKRITKDDRGYYLYEGIPHYVMDFLPPEKTFTVVEWRDVAMSAIRSIVKRKHLPIVVGGTGLYIQALIDNFQIPEVPPQPSFREAMGEKPLAELIEMLLRLDPDASKIVDLKNPRRVIRALEVATFTGEAFTKQRKKLDPVVEPFLMAIKHDRDELRRRINAAVEHNIEIGWIDEIRRLKKEGIAWDAPAMTSIGYRELARYVQGEIPLEEAIQKTKDATWQYAKRQLTWFKRDKRIHWVKDAAEAERLVVKWMEA